MSKAYIILIAFLAFMARAGSGGLWIRDFSVVTPERLELTREYAREHYHIDSFVMPFPKVIFIHYTAIASLEESLNYFRPAVIWDDRVYNRRFGRVNVGAHFVVGPGGDVYSLIPPYIMGRHAIGFNHTSIGIENVSRDEGGLTVEQAESNALLIEHLVKNYPSIEFLAGHYEYTDNRLPHYRHFLGKNEKYVPTVKIDPGRPFMEKVRRILKEKHGIVLER